MSMRLMISMNLALSKAYFENNAIKVEAHTYTYVLNAFWRAGHDTGSADAFNWDTTVFIIRMFLKIHFI